MSSDAFRNVTNHLKKLKSEGCGERIDGTYLRLVCGVDGLCSSCKKLK